MKLSPRQVLPPRHKSYYLHGADQDAIFEAAEALLAAGEPEAVRLRVDVKELVRIEQESKNQGLFGPSCCYALVRNAQSANPGQTGHLLNLVRSVLPDNRLIICAAGIDRKKALDLLVQEEKIILMATHDPILALMGDRRLVIKNGGIDKIIESSQAERKNLASLEELDNKLLALRNRIRTGETLENI